MSKCNFAAMSYLKRQNQSRPLAGNPKYEALNPKLRRLTEHDLKKQSQLAGLCPEIRNAKP